MLTALPAGRRAHDLTGVDRFEFELRFVDFSELCRRDGWVRRLLIRLQKVDRVLLVADLRLDLVHRRQLFLASRLVL
jgi:hypothetical protein